MLETDVIERIKALCQKRSWSYYRLAKESKIAYSTLSSMLNKSVAPSISTLIKICEGFNISLEQFFSEDNNRFVMSYDENSLLQNWRSLNTENKNSVNSYIHFLLSNQDCME